LIERNQTSHKPKRLRDGGPAADEHRFGRRGWGGQFALAGPAAWLTSPTPTGAYANAPDPG